MKNKKKAVVPEPSKKSLNKSSKKSPSLKQYFQFVEGKPIVKARPRICRGRAYTPAHTLKWERYIRECISDFPCKEPLDTEVEVSLTFYLPRPKSLPKNYPNITIKHTKRPDVDNLAKAVLDAMDGFIFVDDSRIWTLHCQKYYGRIDQPSGVQIHVKWMGV